MFKELKETIEKTAHKSNEDMKVAMKKFQTEIIKLKNLVAKPC